MSGFTYAIRRISKQRRAEAGVLATHSIMSGLGTFAPAGLAIAQLLKLQARGLISAQQFAEMTIELEGSVEERPIELTADGPDAVDSRGSAGCPCCSCPCCPWSGCASSVIMGIIIVIDQSCNTIL